MDTKINMFSVLADALITNGAYKATKFVSEKETIKATVRRYKGKIRKCSKIREIIFTYGAPNYEEREVIRKAKKAGKSFPLKGIDLKFVSK